MTNSVVKFSLITLVFKFCAVTALAQPAQTPPPTGAPEGAKTSLESGLSTTTSTTMPAPIVKKKKKTKKKKKRTVRRIYARLHTSMGPITIRLYHTRTPNTVDNFVRLAEGNKRFTDSETNTEVDRPFYDGLTFHRIIKGFLVQAGCPLGNSRGGPGYTIDGEILPELKHDKAGIVSMANESGPDTAGSQFFITLAPSPFLDGKYTIFGEVTAGMKVVEAISATPIAPGKESPVDPITIERVKIIRKYK